MKKSIVIGSTSQLSKYFPTNYERVSSRNINLDKLKNGKYDSVYILFAEQRTFLNETEEFFINVNVNYTLKIINEIKNYVRRIVVYSTSELWNNYDGKIFVGDKYDYNYTPYIKSKEILCNEINEKRDVYSNVSIIYPFNFNSPYRKGGFLFSKVFDSIINKNINFIGDINFKRDIIHPSIIVNESINAEFDKIIGCGELINVEKLVSDLFDIHNMDFKNYLINDGNNNLTNVRKDYYSAISYSNYQDILTLTKKDIYEYKIS